MVQNTIIQLKKGKESSLQRFHPWVFSGAIAKITGNPEEGDIVKVISDSSEFLAYGHYQKGSIAVRIFSFEEKLINLDFWTQKINAALNLRKDMGFFDSDQTNVFRLIHGEGDGLPGFIADFYNMTVVFQFHSIGMYNLRKEFASICKQLLGDNLTAVYDKSCNTLPFKADVPKKDELLLGAQLSDLISEYELNYRIDIVRGQKTGFFVDQRENRQLVKAMSQNRKVLNTFCYSGGFSLAALAGGAKHVHSIDSSEEAIALTDKNVEINFGQTNNHTSTACDALKYLDTMERKYDFIVLDPPAFAKHMNVLNNAMKGYRRINRSAFERILPGGIIFTFSCSQVVSKEHFRQAVFTAAAQAKRNVRIIHQMSQPVDHPVNIYHPESEYLKGLVLYVE